MQRVERSREPIRCRRAWGHYFSIQYDCRLAGHAIRLNLSQCCHMEPAKSRHLTTNQDSKMILSRSRSRNRNRNRCLMKLSSASTALNTVFWLPWIAFHVSAFLSAFSPRHWLGSVCRFGNLPPSLPSSLHWRLICKVNWWLRFP